MPPEAVKSGTYSPRMGATFTTICGWIGSGLMVIFSFTMLPLIGFFGLALLTVQAKVTKMYNLVILNAVSMVGLAYHIFPTL